ncbi:hypothetical protein NLI96_g12959 [Meripilus lineatus]|uniref:Prolyl 4-hydroxylase alpha subunit domain-containing protein n=1 Tax=Meripilus lineatus TaxID=2056292 RepID=A0AAD5URC5_9APHY|nr:hypothetical protein NLI96_g12959 [Physisporinus lineatus]
MSKEEYKAWRAKERNRLKRRAQKQRGLLRLKEEKALGPLFVVLRPFQIARYSSPSVMRLGRFDASIDLKAAVGAFVGPTTQQGPVEECTLQWCTEQGYTIIEWDGRMPEVVTDCRGRILLVLAGRPPNDDTWDDSMGRAAIASEKAEGNAISSAPPARGGPQMTIVRGVGIGEGTLGRFQSAYLTGVVKSAVLSQHPQMLRQHKKNIPALQDIIRDEDVQRVIGVGNSILATYAPKIYREMVEKLTQIYDRDPTLERLFPKSVFPAQTANLGPRTITSFHFDSKNKANGYIVLTSLGGFDPKKGGHLVLKSLKLVVEFPPGSTVLFLSSVIEHANTPVQLHERRMSLTQYAAGGLFRWVDYGFKTQAQMEEDPDHAVTVEAKRKGAWRKAIEQISKVDELGSDQEALIRWLKERRASYRRRDTMFYSVPDTVCA